MTEKKYKLTQYSHGAGCGCKIAPKVLDDILLSRLPPKHQKHLLVGNEARDDAAVMDLGDGTAVISTTDFFMPIVDDAGDFGRIAAVNAISDVYAMGGTPLLAIAILGWPVGDIPATVANEVLEGARIACSEASIPLAGGHSIDAPEPIFGLAVTGRVDIAHLTKNSGAKAGDLLFLTKPLGVGILTTAQKKNKIRTGDHTLALKTMTSLNKVGVLLGRLPSVHAMTDVTGFGLLGHLSEMCKAAGLSAQINFDKVPQIDKEILDFYIEEKCIPGGTHRNFESYGHNVSSVSEAQKALLCDPQTSGGLLVAVDSTQVDEFLIAVQSYGMELSAFGQMSEPDSYLITVN